MTIEEKDTAGISKSAKYHILTQKDMLKLNFALNKNEAC